MEACPSLFDRWTVVIDGDDRPIEEWVTGWLGRLESRVRFVRLQTREGIGAARNAGVAASMGHQLAWLDSDDVLAPGPFLRFAASASVDLDETDRSLFAIADNFDCAPDLSPLFVREKGPIVGLHRQYIGTDSDPLFFVDFVYQPQLIRRSNFEQVGGFSIGTLGEDVDLVLRLALASPDHALLYYPAVAYLYRRNPNGTVYTQYSQLRAQNAADYREARKMRRMPVSGLSRFVLLEPTWCDHRFGFMPLAAPGDTLASVHRSIFYNGFLPWTGDAFPESFSMEQA
jgi:GT2 family glycosyltransferase